MELENRRKNSTLKGFSLIELVLAVSIVATALILFIGIFFAMFRASQKGVDLTAGTVVAESVLNQYLYDQQEKTGGLPVNLTDNSGSPYTGTTSLNKTIFTYEITCQDTDSTDLKRLDVQVWWWQSDATRQDNKEGYGKLHVKLTRMVFTRSKMAIIPAN
ncbi:MAG: type II secretion system GspH family protein [Firmicutes bacterium]|nr:type II secretion system GspH family protein [Bacillota bacterium]